MMMMHQHSPSILDFRKKFSHVPVPLGYTDLEVVYDISSGRRYITPEGKSYPSITTVLGSRGKEGLLAWRKRVGEAEADRISRIAAGNGSLVHGLCERYINNSEEVLSGKEMPVVKQSFLTIKKVLDRALGEVYLQECALYSDHLAVAGRVDLVAKFEGKLSIIDFKTSSRVKSRTDIHNYFIQEAAYAIMVEERTGLPVNNLVTIMAVNNSNEPLIFIEKRDNWVTELRGAIHDYQRDKIFNN